MTAAAQPEDPSGWPVEKLPLLLEIYSGMPDTTMLRVPLGVLRELASRPTSTRSAGSAAVVAARLERLLAVRSAGQHP